MVLGYYKLNSAIERGTKPDAWGRKPCHCTRTFNAPCCIVHPLREQSHSTPLQHLLVWMLSVAVTSSSRLWTASRHDLGQHPERPQPLDLVRRVPRLPQYHIRVLPDRRGPTRRHLRLPCEMKGARHRQPRPIGKGHQRADLLHLYI